MAPVLRAQPQSALEEVADLAEAPADAGLLLDDGPRLLGRADRVLQKVLLQRVLVLGQGAVGVMPPAAAQVRQAALIILVEVALDGAPGDVGGGGDLVVSQAVALEPEDLHLALDAGVGVVVTVVGQGVPVVRREGDDPHDGSTLMLSPGCSPSAVYTHTLPPTIRARPGRAEYNRQAACHSTRCTRLNRMEEAPRSYGRVPSIPPWRVARTLKPSPEGEGFDPPSMRQSAGRRLLVE